MKLLYICTSMFSIRNGVAYGLPANATSFFLKYLDVFEEIKVLGRPVDSCIDASALVPIIDKRINVVLLPPNTSPKEFKNDCIVRNALKKEIENAEAVLIKPSTRRGMMAERIAKRLKKPYMIEVTGDIHNALLHHSDWKKRLYAPILYYNIKRNLKDCMFGLYVSQDYLQNRYPIKGETCGCSDVVIEPASYSVLERRIERINTIHERNRVEIALIGFYQGKMKGVDTAIRALSQLPVCFHLNILGNGTKENREKWIHYGESMGVFNRIHFPHPLPSSNDVLLWLDTQDFFVLPTLSEGLCRCVVEAISRGCPCFCTNITTMPELLPYECLFPPHDDIALARMIKTSFDNPKKMKELAIINFEHSKDYDFELLRERRNAFLQRFREYCEKING